MLPSKTNTTGEEDFKDTNAILKHVLQTITEKCKQEAENNFCALPYADDQARLAHYTGLSNNLINKIISGKQEVSELDLRSRIAILDTVKSLYIKHRLPTYKAIFEEAPKNLKTIDDKLILDVHVFVKEMRILGFILKKTINNHIIAVEDPELRFERYMYLLNMKKIRSNSVQWQQIVYVDERLVNNTQTFKKPWQVDALQTGLEECVFYHAVTNSGFTTGMFTNRVSEDDFAKWLSDILLTHLKSPSVIVMDDNPLHGSVVDASPISRYHSKTEMLRWLTNNNIPCSTNMSKPALYELIAKCNNNQKVYKIDHIIRSQGHEVLRLPHHFFDMSITTPFWDNLIKSGGIREANTLMDMQVSLMKTLNSVTPTMWADYEETILKIEKELFDIDLSLENFCDMYEIKMF